MKTALLALLLVAGCASAGTPAEPSLHFETLLERLGVSHPQYRAMQAEIAAARSTIDAASALPDPELRIELMDIDDAELRPDQVGATKYTIEQRLPLWGKRRLRREAATSAHASATARAGQTLAELRSQLRVAFSEYYAASTELTINAETRALFAQALRSARERQASGLATQQDLIRAQTERSTLLVEAQTLRGRIDRARIALNALTGQALDTPLPPPAALPVIVDFAATCERLLDTDASGSPQLEMLEQELQQRRSEHSLAERERFPDLTVGISPIQTGSRFETWELMLGVSLPLHGGTRARERTQQALYLAAEERQRAALLAVRTVTAAARADYLAAQEAERLIDTRLLPEVRLGYRAALAGYGNAQLDFDAVIAAALQVHSARRQRIEAAVQQQLAVAEFERLTGVQP